jgi:predicted dehydrogenase
MSRRVRVAVVGCGAQAQLAHIPALKANAAVELAALCDTDVRKLNQICQMHGVARHYADFDDLKEASDIDAVVIATPNHLHAPMAQAAMQYGKDVLCEMPLGLNAAEVEKVIATAAHEKRNLMPCLLTRLRPDVQTIRRFIDGGELGRLYYCKAGWLQGRQSWSLAGWRGQRLRAGGGAFLSLGAPVLDAALALLAPAKVVSVIGSAHHRDLGSQRSDARGADSGGRGARKAHAATTDVEDTAFAMVRFESDLLLTVEVGWSLLQERDFTYLNLMGSSGAALMNPVQIHKEMHGHLVNVTPQLSTRDTDRAAQRLLANLWVDSLVRGVEPALPASEALTISRIVDAFYQSQSRRCEVQLPRVGS